MVRVGGLQYAIDPARDDGRAHHATCACAASRIDAGEELQGRRLGAGVREARKRRADLGRRARAICAIARS